MRMRVYHFRGWRFWCGIAGLLVVPFCLLFLGWKGVAAVTSEVRQVPVYEVATEEQKIAISFDASWGAEHTEEILDVLTEYNAGATFFLVNIWVEDYPEMARTIAERGFEIGLHSETHAHFPQLSDGEVCNELANNYQLIQETTRCSPVLFRFPYGDYDNRTVSLVEEAGFSAIQWSIDSLDWKDLSADEIFRRVTKDASAGDIVLFHNNGLHTAEALPQILEYYDSLGLEVVCISDLLLDGGCYTDVNGIQRKE